MTKLDIAVRDFEAEPSRGVFAKHYAAGTAQVVWTRLVADLETPVSAMLKLSDGRPMSCLLESVEGGAVRGRYSIIGINPDIVWRAFGDKAEINRRPQSDLEAFEPDKLPTLKSLRALLTQSRIDLPAELPPIAAGVIGYMGYDTVRLVEHLPNERPDALGVPDSVFVRPTVMVIFDAVKDEMIVVTPVYPQAGIDAEEAYAAAIARLREVVKALDEPLPHATSMSGVELEYYAGGIHGHGRARQGLHRCRRHLPGGAVATLLGAVPPAAAGALSRLAPYQSLAVPVLSRLRRLLAGRLVPRDPGSRARRRGHHPPARRHAAPRRHAGRGQGARGRAAG
jgi:hypothetical protein